ncbi:hypothetical protein BDW74DRAFT_153019 [Aspergillus multicolor]|uniref:uncharacterized protein n=1 Tax=Aspergillus multicolor TaxID=41759 RepID=UPI003CCDC1B0
MQVPQPADSFLLRDARFTGPCLQWGEHRTQTESESQGVQAISVVLRSEAEPASVVEVTIDILNRCLTTSLRLPWTQHVHYPRTRSAR